MSSMHAWPRLPGFGPTAPRSVLAGLTITLAACGGSAEPQPSETLAKPVANVQCEAPRTTLRQVDAEADAAGLEVRARSCAWDGMLYPAVCGAPASFLRVIQIPRNQVAQARALGYRAPSEYPMFVASACPEQ